MDFFIVPTIRFKILLVFFIIDHKRRIIRQNGIAQRFVLSARTDILNHVIIFNGAHLQRLMKEYVEYYNNDRCYLSLGRDSLVGRDIQLKPSDSSKVKSIPKLGGLQHRYEWKQPA